MFDPNKVNTKGMNIKSPKPINLDNYGTLPPGTKTTQIVNRKEGLQEFLKREEKSKIISIDQIRKKYIKEENQNLKIQNM